jgi:hypothetical protein
MDIKTKLEYAKRAIDVIATHEDEDAAFRLAALDNLAAHCVQKKDEINAQVQAHIAEQIGG